MDDRPRRVQPVRLRRVRVLGPGGPLWCADYSGVIRGRSLSTGELDGTTRRAPAQRCSRASRCSPSGAIATSSPSASSRRSSAVGRSTAEDRSHAMSPMATTAPSTALTADGCWSSGRVGRSSQVSSSPSGTPSNDRASAHPTARLARRRLVGRRPARRRHADGHGRVIDVRRVRPRRSRSTSSRVGCRSRGSPTDGSRSGTRMVTSTCSTSTRATRVVTMRTSNESSDPDVRSAHDGAVRRRQPPLRAVRAAVTVSTSST